VSVVFLLFKGKKIMIIVRDPWTEIGYRRLEHRIAGFRREVNTESAEMQEERCGANSIDPERFADQLACSSSATLRALLGAAEKQLGEICIAARPNQSDHVQLGHRVEIKYLDSSSRKERGATEALLLGGKGETDDSEILRTVSYVSKLGKALVNLHVGERALVRTPSGDEYSVKIISISIPDRVTIDQAIAA
jgi:transcription elongation GreA/GreB family factor